MKKMAILGFFMTAVMLYAGIRHKIIPTLCCGILLFICSTMWAFDDVIKRNGKR